jgi:hypothetical protein
MTSGDGMLLLIFVINWMTGIIQQIMIRKRGASLVRICQSSQIHQHVGSHEAAAAPSKDNNFTSRALAVILLSRVNLLFFFLLVHVCNIYDECGTERLDGPVGYFRWPKIDISRECEFHLFSRSVDINFIHKFSKISHHLSTAASKQAR